MEKIFLYSSFFETGNHIAHISDGKGNARYTITKKFQEFLEKTEESKAPWTLYGNALERKEIRLP